MAKVVNLKNAIRPSLTYQLKNADDLPSASADLVHRVIEHPSQTESNRRAPTQMSRTFESLGVMMHLS